MASYSRYDRQASAGNGRPAVAAAGSAASSYLALHQQQRGAAINVSSEVPYRSYPERASPSYSNERGYRGVSSLGHLGASLDARSASRMLPVPVAAGVPRNAAEYAPKGRASGGYVVGRPSSTQEPYISNTGGHALEGYAHEAPPALPRNSVGSRPRVLPPVSVAAAVTGAPHHVSLWSQASAGDDVGGVGWSADKRPPRAPSDRCVTRAPSDLRSSEPLDTTAHNSPTQPPHSSLSLLRQKLSSASSARGPPDSAESGALTRLTPEGAGRAVEPSSRGRSLLSKASDVPAQSNATCSISSTVQPPLSRAISSGATARNSSGGSTIGRIISSVASVASRTFRALSGSRGSTRDAEVAAVAAAAVAPSLRRLPSRELRAPSSAAAGRDDSDIYGGTIAGSSPATSEYLMFDRPRVSTRIGASDLHELARKAESRACASNEQRGPLSSSSSSSGYRYDGSSGYEVPAGESLTAAQRAKVPRVPAVAPLPEAPRYSGPPRGLVGLANLGNTW